MSGDEIRDPQRSAGRQRRMHGSQRLGLHLARHMVEGKRGHQLCRARGAYEFGGLVAESAIKSDDDSLASRLLLRAPQGVRIGIDACKLKVSLRTRRHTERSAPSGIDAAQAGNP
jgi:hypothetical protein